MKRENLVEEYMASYPVLRFSFNGVTELNYSQLIKNILIKMQEWCLDNISTFDFSKCAKSDVACYDRLQLGIACGEYKDLDTGMELKTSDMQRFLSVVIRMLSNSYGEKVVVLLDEYEVPLAKASVMDELVDIGKGKYVPVYTAMKQFMASF